MQTIRFIILLNLSHVALNKDITSFINLVKLKSISINKLNNEKI
ncbi:MAG: hypothetical protein K0Q97_33 [Bacillota bacterium]|nr:hypothetical protein [Bacillota bacterium]